MAFDKAVDSAVLNTSLGYTAARIRAKTGGSAQIAFDTENQTGFGDAVDAIPSGGGLTLSPMDYAVKVKNGRSSTITVNRILYNETTFLAVTSSNISAGATSSYSNLATDGTHFWVRFSAGTTLSYDGAQATYVKDGGYFEITIPSGFDGTKEFTIS